MNNGKQIVTRCIAILMLCGIVLLSGYGLYRCIADFDKPVVAESNGIGGEKKNTNAPMGIFFIFFKNLQKRGRKKNHLFFEVTPFSRLLWL